MGLPGAQVCPEGRRRKRTTGLKALDGDIEVEV